MIDRSIDRSIDWLDTATAATTTTAKVSTQLRLNKVFLPLNGHRKKSEIGKKIKKEIRFLFIYCLNFYYSMPVYDFFTGFPEFTNWIALNLYEKQIINYTL